MWPFSEMSLAAASKWFDVANAALVFSLVLGVLSTFAIVRLGNIKEHYWDVARDESSERIKELEASIADANARAKEAELRSEQLRKQVGPRQLLRDVFIGEIRGQPSSKVEIMYLIDSPDSFNLAQQIWEALKSANWQTEAPKPIPTLMLSDSPTPMSVGGQPAGVTVVVRDATEDESNALRNAMMGHEWLKTPFTVLLHALAASVGNVSGHAGGPNVPPADILRIVVAPRL